ncbi:hypothetical protein NY751_21110 [Xanthomonas campestris]|uniref:P-loop ATPase, Sll1717 family n=1 Tax=Xanthomonas campestris TaxID=339 RepID=UPI0023580C93|nr:hypothetical protein [Xanthomonas campestris]MDC8748507.1 hypothetical protein [Xanthomonas campestris]
MKLRDFDLGTTDAKNSLLNNTEGEAEMFLASFVEPENLQLDKFFDGRKYYVTGLKGIGKTALLRYIAKKLESESSQSVFVLFKSDIDESVRKNFAAASRVHVVEENSRHSESNDYESAWRWLIYKKIVQAIDNNIAEPFQRTPILEEFIALLKSEKEDSRTGIKRIIPSVKKGQIEISKSPKFSLDLEWDGSGSAKLKFLQLVEKADEIFKNLPSSSSRLNIFFDELEVTYSSTRQHERDAGLIRDLIVSIEKINATAKGLGYQIFLYAAIRSEVLKSVKTIGKEINKPIADFGTEISWNQSKEDLDHPLLKIIEKRINASLEAHGEAALPTDKLWEKYFPQKIDDTDPKVHILHSSWYRPRDIFRIILLAQDQYPNAEAFDRSVLKAIRKQYATASWTELTEELTATYKDQELEGLRHLLFGFNQIFAFAELDEISKQRSEEYPGVRKLLEAHELRKIVGDLYRIGVLGNFNSGSKKFRFSFRGDADVIFGEKLYIHNALRSLLSV